ncbi:hypothetical protein J6590_029030 [Homalodisca vitripennis]|nr:hypothetical protein J6590_029030 [Homalodisca vitripennis]
MSTLQRLVAKLEKTGSVNNQPKPRRQRNNRSIENVAASIPRRAQELGLLQNSTWQIFASGFRLASTTPRRLFAEWALERLERTLISAEKLSSATKHISG